MSRNGYHRRYQLQEEKELLEMEAKGMTAAQDTVPVDREDLARLTRFVRGVAKLRNVPNLADEAAARRCESILEGKG